ncbi:unnamed protein product [Adineta steineri]|uniref:Uncharacterized protein n=1 Tax=Adineta steineri TaxID=433720 RepID=A0A814JI61_9BILA|nr:unnamed protein product [Adineta steineri]CAF1265236.1 unnamed protein product [Adineta steineri]CAF1320066.1 unnamed protein product [Adineta steineri]
MHHPITGMNTNTAAHYHRVAVEMQSYVNQQNEQLLHSANGGFHQFHGPRVMANGSRLGFSGRHTVSPYSAREQHPPGFLRLFVHNLVHG